MDEETLIEQVRAREAIWNKDHKMYKNNLYKGKEWEQIARNVGETKNDCMKTWKKLLAKYKKEREMVRKTRTSGCGLDEAYYSPWPYYENMEFVNISIDAAETSGNSDEVFHATNAIRTPVQANESYNRECSLPRTSREEVHMEEEHDMLYFKNLLPYTAKLEAPKKLLLQTEMNELVFKYTYPTENWQNLLGPLGMQNQPGPSRMQNQSGPSGMQNQPRPSGMQNQPGPSEMQNQPGPSRMQNQPGPSGMQNQPRPSGMQYSQDKIKHKHVQIKKEIDSDYDSDSGIEYLNSVVLPVKRSSAQIVKKETKVKTEASTSSDIAAAAAVAAAGAYATAGWRSFLQTVGVSFNCPTTSSTSIDKGKIEQDSLHIAKRIKVEKNDNKKEKRKQLLLKLNGADNVIEISDDENDKATTPLHATTAENSIKIEKNDNQEEKYKPHLLTFNGVNGLIEISDDENDKATTTPLHATTAENPIKIEKNDNQKNNKPHLLTLNDDNNVIDISNDEDCEQTQRTSDHVESEKDSKNVEMPNDEESK